METKTLLNSKRQTAIVARLNDNTDIVSHNVGYILILKMVLTLYACLHFFLGIKYKVP